MHYRFESRFCAGALPFPPEPARLWLAVATAGTIGLSLLLPSWMRANGLPVSLPQIICSAAANTSAVAPAPAVKILRSEPLVGAQGKRVTTLLVQFPPHAVALRHIHGGDVTAFVLQGTIRSQHAGLPLASYHAGETFFEPYGTEHSYSDNPSATEPAELLAIIVHDEGAKLTTYLD